eukprot:scpid17657/ scgid5431/ 
MPCYKPSLTSYLKSRPAIQQPQRKTQRRRVVMRTLLTPPMPDTPRRREAARSGTATRMPANITVATISQSSLVKASARPALQVEVTTNILMPIMLVHAVDRENSTSTGVTSVEISEDAISQAATWTSVEIGEESISQAATCRAYLMITLTAGLGARSSLTESVSKSVTLISSQSVELVMSSSVGL